MGKRKRKRSPNQPLNPAEVRLVRVATRGIEERGQRSVTEMAARNAIRIAFPREPFPWNKYGPFLLAKGMMDRRLEESVQLAAYACLIEWFEAWRKIDLFTCMGIRHDQIPPSLRPHVIRGLGTVILARRVTYNPNHVFLEPFMEPEDEDGNFDRARD